MVLILIVNNRYAGIITRETCKFLTQYENRMCVVGLNGLREGVRKALEQCALL